MAGAYRLEGAVKRTQPFLSSGQRSCDWCLLKDPTRKIAFASESKGSSAKWKLGKTIGDAGRWRKSIFSKVPR